MSLIDDLIAFSFPTQKIDAVCLPPIPPFRTCSDVYSVSLRVRLWHANSNE